MSVKLLIEALGILLAWLLSWRLRSAGSRQILFLLSSYVFYASFGLWFLAVLVASTLMNYAWGAYLRRQPTTGRLWGGVLLNLLLLGSFKYLPGVAETWAQQSFFAAKLAQFVQPIGISFWTFEALSYLLDIYQEQELNPSLLEFSLYMAFGPTVLSGPICRLQDLLAQFRAAWTPKWRDVRSGLQRIWLGVFMMTLARALGAGLQPGQGTDAGFHQAGPGGIDVWLLAIGYGFQLFFDFAGYSHIAIGVARLFGFRLPENFNRPYLSTTPSEFWTRWHMSLSFWIRDYVFLPLASVRREIWWRNLSLVVSMVIFGVWHKATLAFIVWGAYQGALLLLHRLWQRTQRRFGFEWSGWLATSISSVATFLAMCLGWIFFRAENLKQAITMVGAVLSPASYGAFTLAPNYYLLVAVTLAGYFLLEAVRAWSRAEDEPVLSWIPIELRVACYAAMLYLVVFRAAQPQAFIYFQF